MKKKTLVMLTVFLAFLFLLPVSAGAEGNPVAANEIEGSWKKNSSVEANDNVEDYDYDWDWDFECDCEDKPVKGEHAEPVAAVIISIIAALGAILGGASGSAGGIFSSSIAEAPGIPGIGTGTADYPDYATGAEEPSPEEREMEDTDTSLPPEVGFGGPEDNPFTNFHGGRGPGDCVRHGLPRYFVNTATLNLVVQDTVFQSSGLGPEINLTLTYNSASTTGGIFGHGWTFSYEWLLEQVDEKINVRKGSGQSIPFTLATSGSTDRPAEASPPAGIFHRLLSYGDYWLYIEKDSSVFYRFDRVPGMNIGRLTAISDYHGNTVKLDYGPRGNMETITDAAGRSIGFTFNEQNRCTAFALPDGRQATFTYDERGCLIRTVDLMGIDVDYQYDASHSLTRMVTASSERALAFTYREANKRKLLHSFTDPNGNTTRYELLSSFPFRVEITGPDGHKNVIQSRAGLTEMATDPLGQAAILEYYNRLPVKYRDRNGGETRWKYGEAGRLTGEINPDGREVSFAYDRRGNLVRITDPLGGSWVYLYDDKNSLVRITSPAGRNLSMDYDDRGQLIGLIGFDGEKTVLDYDNYGNIATVTLPGGGTATSSYDEYGYTLASVTNELGHTASFEYDGNGRLINYRHPDGAEKRMVFDCCYNLLSTDERGHSMGYERDPNGNVIKEIDAAAAASELAYDSNNNLLSHRDRCGRITLFNYDAARRLIGTINALGQSQNYGYDPAGDLISFQVEGERRTTFQYDPCHRRISETDPLGATVSFERDALGRVAVRKSARGKEVSFAYDPDGLLEKVFHDRQEVGSYRYGTGGMLIETEDESGKMAFEHDEAGRIKRIAYTEGMELSCTYNTAGLVESVIYPGELAVRYTYDNRMRPAEISWRSNWIKYTYDAAGNLVREMRSNGTESNYQYDENGRLVKLEHGRTGEEAFIKRHYARDAGGTILEEEGFQPLLPPEDHDFNFSCNIADQIADATPSSFGYDADGNLTSAPGWAADYDAGNRLVELTRGNVKRRYLYNSLGHRVRTVTADSTLHRYYDPVGNLMFEACEGEAPRFYLYCHCRPVAMVDKEGANFFYHYDQGGNTLALTAEDGTVATSYAYSPFGRCIKSGEIIDNPFTFCGASGVIDEEEGLYFMKKRFYSAPWGRFVQKDPLGLEGGINSYAYAANNPLTYIDPDGALVAEAWLAWKTVGAIVGVVTLTAAAAKTAYNAYKSGSSLSKESDAVSKANKLYKEYQDVCKKHGQFGGLKEKEIAYWKYEQAYKEVVKYHNRMTEGAKGTVEGVVDVGVNLVTPDALNLPIVIYEATSKKQEGPYPGDPRNPCGNHIPGIVRKEPRLHY